ncbi:hypothetical protein ABS71_13445 [bacterium SCN 62-11]|nr:MAG: hypothetical protein ABS71_13445 [bacterium SCN 62-11]
MKAAGLLVLVWLLLVGASGWDDSPAFDEAEHATAGYLSLVSDGGWLNPAHPPLTKWLAGAAMLPLQPRLPGEVEVWNQFRAQNTVRAFFYEANAPQPLVRAARVPGLLLSGGFLLGFFGLGRRWLGERRAGVAAFLLACNPSWIAHSRYVTNDVAAAGAFFMTLAALLVWRERGGWKQWFLFALALSLAQLVKFSMVLLLPLSLCLGWRRPGGLLLSWLAAGVTVWLAYAALTSTFPLQYQQWYVEKALHGRADWLKPESEWQRPPAWYLTGLLSQQQHLRQGHVWPSYLNGQFYRQGRRDYFLQLAFFKEPLAALLLLGLALSARRRPPRPILWLLGAAGVYALVAALGNLNLGIRHLLPCYPIYYLALAACLPRGRVTLALLAALGLTVLISYPRYLSFFNGLSAGRSIGLDSNSDWGTDLLRLKFWMERNHPQPLALLYFGHPDPVTYLGSGYLPLAEARLQAGQQVAVSRTYYELARTAQGQHYPNAFLLKSQARPDWSRLGWLERVRPEAQVGDSILIFRVPAEP